MTQKKAQKCLRTAYPEGDIWRDGHKICVVFKAGGRVYSYGHYTAYEGVLEHLGLQFADMQAKREAEYQLNEYRKEHGTERKSIFGKGTYIVDRSAEIARLEKYLASKVFV